MSEYVHYRPETNDELFRRFSLPKDWELQPKDVDDIHQAVSDKINEADSQNLTINDGQCVRAKGVKFGSGSWFHNAPSVVAYIHLKTDLAKRNTIVTLEYDYTRIIETYAGGLGVRSITYNLAEDAGKKSIAVTGFKPGKLVAVEEPDSTSRADAYKLFNMPIDGEDIEAQDLDLNPDPEEPYFRKEVIDEASLQGHGFFMDNEKDEPTMQVTDLPKALKLLSALSIVTNPDMRFLYGMIRDSEMVKPASS